MQKALGEGKSGWEGRGRTGCVDGHGWERLPADGGDDALPKNVSVQHVDHIARIIAEQRLWLKGLVERVGF